MAVAHNRWRSITNRRTGELIREMIQGKMGGEIGSGWVTM
jgi:hypothetical protein